MCFYELWTILGLTSGKHLIKIISDIKIENGIFEICQISSNSEHCNCGTNLGRTSGTYFTKIFFDIKIETEISGNITCNKFQ